MGGVCIGTNNHIFPFSFFWLVGFFICLILGFVGWLWGGVCLVLRFCKCRIASYLNAEFTQMF